MKSFVAFVLLFIAFSSFGQVGTTFKKAENKGISIQKLDLQYPGGIDLLPKTQKPSPGLAPEQVYQNAYISMLQELGKFLSNNNFKWEKPTKGFNRIYFNPDGSIAYFLYNFKPGEITAEKEKQFDVLLNQFIKDYRFGYPMKQKFAQCSPVTYMN